MLEMLQSNLSKRRTVGYDFVSEDGKWRLSLTRDYLALSTSSYRTWEDFTGHLNGPLSALVEIYKPAFFSRIGLRYQDVVRRSQLSLANTDWSELIKPPLAGLLSSPGIAPNVGEMLTQAVVRLPQFAAKVKMNFGIGVDATVNDEECFIVDSDFWTDERVQCNDVATILAYFNRQSGRLFRWCIEDRLHESMGPQPGAASHSGQTT